LDASGVWLMDTATHGQGRLGALGGMAGTSRRGQTLLLRAGEVLRALPRALCAAGVGVLK